MTTPRVKRAPESRAAYTITEVAGLLGHDRRTIYRWLEQGLLREVRIPGGRRMIDAASLEKLLKGQARARSQKARLTGAI